MAEVFLAGARGAATGLEARSDATTEAFDFLGFFLGGSTTTGSNSMTGAFLAMGVDLRMGAEAGGTATVLVEGGVGLARGVEITGKEATMGAACGRETSTELAFWRE